MGRPDTLEDWHIDLITYMVRHGVSLKHAATELGKEITNEEAHLLLRWSSFNRRLWAERHRFHAELAKDPAFGKDSIAGKFMVQCQKLEEEGDFAKASDVLYKLAKLMGYIGPDSQVSVFGSLSQADLDEIRKKVEDGNIGIRPRSN